MKLGGNNDRRSYAIETVKARLTMPRVQISLILAATAMAAFLCSAILLRTGTTSMAVRYSVAVVVGYLVFLVLLRVWIWWQCDESTAGNAIVDGDIVAVVSDVGMPEIASSAGKGFSFGGGGDFAGGGAGGAWSDADAPVAAPVAFSSGSSSSFASASSSSSGLPDLDVDLDEGVALILVVVVLALVFSALIYVVWIAPILFAELLIDAAVVGSLYKPMKNIERRHWLRTALRKTGIPALIVLLLFFFAGLIMQSSVPEAVTIGQFLNEVL